jgi:hypothetical protein
VQPDVRPSAEPGQVANRTLAGATILGRSQPCATASALEAIRRVPGFRHIAAPEIETPELAPMLEAPTDVSVLDAAAPAEGHRDAATTRATDSNNAIWLSV